MILAETYWELMKDPAHWMFEITLIVIFDVLLGMILYPLFKQWLKNHDERKHAHEHCEEIHPVVYDQDDENCSECGYELEWDDHERMWFCPYTWQHG